MTTVVKMERKQFRACWFIVMFFNFVFGVVGVIICTLKLQDTSEENVQYGFFKLSMIFAAGNLILSVLLLVSVLKDDHKYAFLYALLIFLSLFAATIHIESHTSHDYTFLIIFAFFALLCFLWFCIYGAYHYWRKEFKRNEEGNNETTVPAVV